MEFSRVCHILDSSNIVKIEYDPSEELMRVTFTNGDAYDYKVEPTIFGTLLGAQSVGKAFHKLVKPYMKGKKL